MTSLFATVLATQSWLLAQAAPAATPYAGVAGSGAIGNGIIYSIVIGAIIGIIAKFLTPGRDPGGCIITILIGIGGSFLAYFLGRLLGIYGQGDTPGIIMSIIGAVILLLLFRVITGRRGGGTPSV